MTQLAPPVKLKDMDLTCPCGCGEKFRMRFRQNLAGKTEFVRAYHLGTHDNGKEVYDYPWQIGQDGIHQLIHEFDIFNTWEEGNEQPQA